MKIQPKEVTLKNGIKTFLRSAVPSDAEAMLNHLRTTHREAYRNLNQPPTYWNGFSAEAEEKILADFESSPSKLMLVAVVDGAIVGGLGMVGMQGDFIKHNASLGMSIQQRFCNTGLGTEMIKHALEVGQKVGFSRVSLTVRTHNISGIALYEKVGFQKIGLLKEAALIDGQYMDEYSYEIILR
jgi:RimJ/RimL family protein N-acetyltransferase